MDGFDEVYTFNGLIVKLVNLDEHFKLSINDEEKGTFNIEDKVIILDWIERYSSSIALTYNINDNEYLSLNDNPFDLLTTDNK